jgi:hypothetical protein
MKSPFFMMSRDPIIGKLYDEFIFDFRFHFDVI